jgi:hypothetical protein
LALSVRLSGVGLWAPLPISQIQLRHQQTMAEPESAQLATRNIRSGLRLVGNCAKDLDCMPVFFDSPEIIIGRRSDARNVAVILEVGELDASSDRVSGGAAYERFIVLACTLRHRIQGCNDAIRKALGAEQTA